MTPRNRIVKTFLFLCALALFYGCDEQRPVPIPSATPTLIPFPTSTAIHLDAVQLLNEVVKATDNLQSFHYEIMVHPFVTGDFAAPDKCRISSEKEGTVTQIADRSYEQHAGENTFVRLVGVGVEPKCEGFLGNLHIEVSDLTWARILGEEVLDGHKVTHIEFAYNPNVFGPFLPGAGPASGSSSGTDLWVEKGTNFIVKLVPSLDEPEFYIVYSGFNEPVTPPIEEPSPDKVVKVVNVGPPTPGPLPTTVLPKP